MSFLAAVVAVVVQFDGEEEGQFFLLRVRDFQLFGCERSNLPSSSSAMHASSRIYRSPLVSKSSITPANTHIFCMQQILYKTLLRFPNSNMGLVVAEPAR